MARILLGTALALSGCARDGADTDDAGGLPFPAPDRARFVGCSVQRESDDGPDGTIDSRYATTYDALGWTATSRSDYDGDGIDDAASAYAGRNAYGRYELLEHDAAADGAIDHRTVGEYAGPFWVSLSHDLDGDGANDEVWTFDPPVEAEGSFEVSAEIDEGDDGTVDATYVESFDRSGARLYDERVAADGTLLAETSYSYDGEQLIGEEWFDAEIGTFSYAYTYADAEAREPERVRLTARQIEDDSDYTAVLDYTYGEDGRTSAVDIEIDIDTDGEIDVVQAEAWSWSCP